MPDFRLLVRSKEGFSGYLWQTFTMGTWLECWEAARGMEPGTYQIVSQEGYNCIPSLRQIFAS